MKKRRMCLGLLTFPIGNAGVIPTSHLVEILYTFSSELFLITGNEGYQYFKNDNRIQVSGIVHKQGGHTFSRILRYIYSQSVISYIIIRNCRKVDVWVFFIGGSSLILPMITAKLLRKKVIISFAGSSVLSLQSESNILLHPVKILTYVNCALSDKIILYASSLIEEWKLTKYSNKISIAHEHFLDQNLFKNLTNYFNRVDQVAYVGRFSQEKGVLNFINSIPILIESNKDLNFTLIGDGELKDIISNFIIENNLTKRVEIISWIKHEKLPEYLNSFKLVVVPSDTEGLPNIILECMSCGTPVLATPVGAIPDLIIDEKTGFIMENNLPETIAKNIIRALESPNISYVISNSMEIIKMEFSYEHAVKLYYNIIESL